MTTYTREFKIRLYILWTAIYFPVTFIHGRRDGMPFTRFVLGFIKQLLFVGENYNSWHLWFLLAEVYALIILRILIRRLNNRVIITGIALTLWMFGNMFTDLCFRIDLLPPLLKTVMLFLRILFTDNGRLFTAFLYIWVGANLKDIILVFDKFLNKSVVMGIGIIGGFIRLIGNDIELIAAFGTLILSCSILILALFTNKYMPGKGYPIYLYLRKISMIVYFIHMYVWMIWYIILYQEKTYGIISFIATATTSFAIAFIKVSIDYNIKSKN